MIEWHREGVHLFGAVVLCNMMCYSEPLLTYDEMFSSVFILDYKCKS